MVITRQTVLTLLALMLTVPAGAQQPGSGASSAGQAGAGLRPGEGAAPGFVRPQRPALMQALDTNQDGELSAEEIANAAGALGQLDRNSDGRITRDELMSAAGVRQMPGAAGPGAGGAGLQDGKFLSARVDQIMKSDVNADGKLTPDGLPSQMPHLIERGDADGDGAVDKAELEKLMLPRAQAPNGATAPR